MATVHAISIPRPAPLRVLFLAARSDRNLSVHDLSALRTKTHRHDRTPVIVVVTALSPLHSRSYFWHSRPRPRPLPGARRRAAGVARFRPIVLTSLMTFAGLTPLLLERSVTAQFLRQLVDTRRCYAGIEELQGETQGGHGSGLRG